MLVLLAFALVAGAGTAVSPCVLPVLPALLSAGATGGRRRPLGIVLGLAVTFTSRGRPRHGGGGRRARRAAPCGPSRSSCCWRSASRSLVPRVADRLEARLSRLARLGPRSRGDGFWSGLGVGAALGFVYAPCAGPDPGRGHLGRRHAGRSARRWRSRSPMPPARRPCCSPLRWAGRAAGRPHPRGRARPGAPARARAVLVAHRRGRDARQPRRPPRDGDRATMRRPSSPIPTQALERSSAREPAAR